MIAITDFHRTYVNDESFIRGAARILWAGTTVTFPTKIGDIINMSLYDAQTGWNELGATKTGIQITRNNAEEEFDVDQIYGAIKTEPTDWEVSVSTALAEMTLERLQFAWEGGAVVTDTAPTTGNEKVATFGNPRSYTQRRLAVLFPRPNGKIQAYIFRLVQRAPQESTISHSKTGEQISIPVKFTCLPDLSISDENARYFEVRTQV